MLDIWDYTLSQARQRFKNELNDLLELLEENKILTNDEWDYV